MGWASGSELAASIIRAARKNIDCGGKSKIAFYKDMIEAFENADCDTLDACLGIDALFDKAYEAA